MCFLYIGFIFPRILLGCWSLHVEKPWAQFGPDWNRLGCSHCAVSAHICHHHCDAYFEILWKAVSQVERVIRRTGKQSKSKVNFYVFHIQLESKVEWNTCTTLGYRINKTYNSPNFSYCVLRLLFSRAFLKIYTIFWRC